MDLTLGFAVLTKLILFITNYHHHRRRDDGAYSDHKRVRDHVHAHLRNNHVHAHHRNNMAVHHNSRT